MNGHYQQMHFRIQAHLGVKYHGLAQVVLIWAVPQRVVMSVTGNGEIIGCVWA
jgi:hypothetical protein